MGVFRRRMRLVAVGELSCRWHRRLILRLSPGYRMSIPTSSVPSIASEVSTSPSEWWPETLPVTPIRARADRAGERVYIAISLLATAYVAVGGAVGLPLLIRSAQQGQWALVAALAATLIVSVLTALQVSAFSVFSAILLYRACTLHASLRFVQAPPVVPDEQLPAVTIQIPGRNEPLRVVRRSIESVLLMNYPTAKLQVQYLDNSDPGCWEDVRAYCESVGVEVLHRKGTQGFKAGNLNMGLQSARGELIGLLDVGDTFPSSAVRYVAAEFLQDSSLGFVQTVQEINNADESLIARCESHMVDALQRFGLGVWSHYGLTPLGGHGVLIAKRALLSIGGWDESLVSEDWAAGCAMSIRGWHGKWVDYAAAGEASPTTLDQLQQRSRKWATGATELLRRKLPEYLRSGLPWRHRLDLTVRLSTMGCNIIRHLGIQLCLIWCGVAIASTAPSGAVAYGLGMTLVQWVYPLMFGVQALLYVREGRWARATGVLVFFPLYVAYNVLVMVHTALGVASGLYRRVNVFTITPKDMVGHGGWLHFLGRQRWVLGSVGLVVAAMGGVAAMGRWELVMVALPLVVYGALVLAGLSVLAFAETRRSRTSE